MRTDVSAQLGYIGEPYRNMEARIRALDTDTLRAHAIRCLTDPRLQHTLMNQFRLAVCVDEMAARVLEAEANAA